MNFTLSLLALTVLALPVAACAAETVAPTIGKVIDGQIKSAESEIVSLAEAMPAEKYDFAPTAGEFKGVRTFEEQMKHIAAVIYIVASGALGEKNPDKSDGEKGPTDVKGRDAVVRYLKDAFAYGHKAAQNLTLANSMDMLPSPFGSGKATRIGILSIIAWHSFDHYGQVVVYARMNGIVPPASK